MNEREPTFEVVHEVRADAEDLVEHLGAGPDAGDNVEIVETQVRDPLGLDQLAIPLAQGLFRLLAAGDVVDDPVVGDEPAPGVEVGYRRVEHPAHPSVLARDAVLKRGDPFPRENPRDVGDHPFAVLRHHHSYPEKGILANSSRA